MIYLTQLIFVIPGKEKEFQAFEDFAIPLMQQYKGRIEYRVRPTRESFIDETKELPYEIHFISFDGESDFQSFMQDKTRLKFMHLKETSIKSSFLVKGEKF